MHIPRINIAAIPLSYIASAVLAAVFLMSFTAYFTLRFIFERPALKELFLYCLVGFINTVISWAFYLLLTRVLHINYLVSTVINFVVCVLIAFVLNRKTVFNSTSPDAGRELFLFFALRIASGAASVGIMYLGVDIMGISDLIMQLILMPIVVISNYIFSKFIIFKKPKEEIYA